MTLGEVRKVEARIKTRCFFANGYWTYRFKNGSEVYLTGKRTSNVIKLLKFGGDYEEAFRENMEA